MTCCLLDVCPLFAQSRHYEGPRELRPTDKAPTPKLKHETL